LDDLEIVQDSIDEAQAEAETLAYQVKSGEITPSRWKEAMIGLIVAEMIRQYLFGRGNKGNSGRVMVPSAITANLAQSFPDLSASQLAALSQAITQGGGVLSAEQVTALIGAGITTEGGFSLSPVELALLNLMGQTQMAYLENFASELDGLTINEIIRRSDMYMAATRQAYEQGKASQYGIELPAYPGDGSTPCLTNCKCNWRIEDGQGFVLAYWELGQAEHCPVCVDRSETWNPYIVRLQ